VIHFKKGKDLEKKPSTEDIVLQERKFLHDVSNHLLVAQGMGSFLERSLLKNETVSEKEKERMEKVQGAIKKIIDLVKERRTYLHEISEDLDI